MKNKDFNELTDEELLIEKKNLKKSKMFYALSIGFLAGIFIFGLVSFILNPEKPWFKMFPLLITVFFIYKILKNSKKNKALEEVLKKRNLS